MKAIARCIKSQANRTIGNNARCFQRTVFFTLLSFCHIISQRATKEAEGMKRRREVARLVCSSFCAGIIMALVVPTGFAFVVGAAILLFGLGLNSQN